MIDEASEIFKEIDTDGDGFITPTELIPFLKKLGLNWSKGEKLDIEEIDKIFMEIDTDGDGLITYDEFVRWFNKRD
ncbi:MAG: EF-hand domain-containing protein [Promethearchaeota archaeon]